jgi:hypothetical protein
MTTKILSGSYPNGYTLKTTFTGVGITATGSVASPNGIYYGGSAGTALTLPNGGTLVNRGSVTGGTGAAGANGVGTYYPGYPLQIVYSTYPGPGGDGGAGVTAAATAQITNFGVISGGAGGRGGYAAFESFQGGGVAGTPGTGGAGVLLEAGGRVTNFATIAGGPYDPRYLLGAYGGPGVELSAGGIVINGSASDRGALIEGGVGVDLTGAGTVVNFGTIGGEAAPYQNQVAVYLHSATDVVIAEGGSDFIGAVNGYFTGPPGSFVGHGTLELRAGATGTIGGIGGLAKVTFADGASWVFQGGAYIPTGLVAHAGGTLLVEGGLRTHGLLAAEVTIAGQLGVDAGKALSLIGGNLTNLSGGTLTGGVFAVYAGGRLQLPDNSAVTTLDATVELVGPKGAVNSLDTATGAEIGLGSSLTSIGVAGVLDLTAPLGAPSDGSALIIHQALATAGAIEVLGGTLTAEGAVSGAGTVEIALGVATFEGAFAEDVTFGYVPSGAPAGILKLAQSRNYTGTISGFRNLGAELDLADIAFISGTTKATYSGTTSGGVLTVTDGTHTSQIHLAGDFTTSTFTLASDGHGGTTVVDPPATGAASAAPLASAMAAFAPAAAAMGPSHPLAATGIIPARILVASERAP